METSTKVLFKIKNRWTGTILFEYESETLRNAVVKAAESGADLSSANLSGANLSGADLSGAYLSGADLRSADLQPIKDDLFIVLLHSIHEIPFLKQAILDGKIDGSTYKGECACLSGTTFKGAEVNNGPQQKEREDLIMKCRDSNRPIERFFLGIKPGDTPENNQPAKLVIEWIEEFEKLIK